MPLCKANASHLEKILLSEQHLWDKLFEKPLDTSVKSLIPPVSPHYSTRMSQKQLSGERRITAMSCSHSLQAQSEQRTTCLKEMEQYLALDLMKILQLQMQAIIGY